MISSKNTVRVLIADDDPDIAKVLRFHLKSWRLDGSAVYNKQELLERLGASEPLDVLLLDVRFGEADGLELVRDLCRQYPKLFIVMITAYGSIDLAISAIKSGARDFLMKPIDMHRLKALIDESIEQRGLYQRAGDDSSELKTSPKREKAVQERSSEIHDHGIIGHSQATLNLIKLVRRVAPTEANILITGESGTGKEVVARAIHQLSRRYVGPFLPLNMAALPGELVESTLFGHEKGAFTGADTVNAGVVEAAEGGTLFLDEIGDMRLELQAKLLRFLQERTFHRVGSSKPRKADVRIVSATNQDLMDRIKRGLFREDLYYRLNVVPVQLISLAQRPDDIPDLVEHFLKRIGARNGLETKPYTPEAMTLMQSWRWPGNVRELENTVERIEILSEGPTITLDDIPSEIRQGFATPAKTLMIDTELKNEVDDDDLEMGSLNIFAKKSLWIPKPDGLLESETSEENATIDSMEMRAIEDAIAFTHGNVRAAARRLGIGAATIYRKMKKYGITKQD